MNDTVKAVRTYPSSNTVPGIAASFTAATVVAVLGHEDWQISDDAASAGYLLLTECVDETNAGDTVHVSVSIDRTGVVITAHTDEGWVRTVAVHPVQQLITTPRLPVLRL